MMRSCMDNNVKWNSLCLSYLASTVALCLLVTSARGEGAIQRFPVTPEMVVTAMKYRQLPIDGVQVRLSAPITSLSPNPMLDIQTMTMVDAHNAQLRMACRTRSECLPFYVAATWPSASAGVTVPGSLAHKRDQVKNLSLSTEPSTSALRRGATATLLIEDEKVHIRLRVICLEAGVTGDHVRVSTPDRKVAYKAEIVAPNLLKGSF